ncbi:MAG: 6-bladed beta-propeller, partial [Maribacter sp.]
MKNLYLFFLFLFLCLSCSDKPTENKAQPVSVSDDFVSYRLDSDQPQERFANLIESVEVVRLEETENSLLSYIYELKQTDDLFVFKSGRESDVFVFDMNGDFVRKI